MTDDRRLTVLDGGMGRQLERMGAPFRLPEWSALALIEAPDFVGRAHDAFIDAGANVITTNTYGLTPHHIGLARFESEARVLADRAGRVARQSAAAAARPILVAGSIPPPFESYQPGRFDAARAPKILAPIVVGLAPHVDLWLAETQSSIAEVKLAASLATPIGKPLWLSFTLRDEAGWVGPALLRSGESVAEGVRAALDLGAEAVLFNCSQPEVMEAAVDAAASVIGSRSGPAARIGVYANAFLPEPKSDEPYAGISRLRGDLDPRGYLAWCERWAEAGASIIGGCCGIGPEHISEIANLASRRTLVSA